MNEAFKALSDTRRAILVFLKWNGGATTTEVAAHLEISDEGARQHLVLLERRGWVARRDVRPATPRSGRPTARYELSDAGESLFPRRYDELSMTLLDFIVERHGREALRDVLARIADRRVESWTGRLRGRSLEERVEALRDLYEEDDAFASVERRDGRYLLIERNCPFSRVAAAHPELCGATLTTLTRLLGVRVRRLERMHAGDGRCVFEITPDEPADAAAMDVALE
jgi:predicted ArsR family transcriptional regulator